MAEALPGGREGVDRVQETAGAYSLALKRNELSNHEETYRKLKCISQGEKIQSEKATSCLISNI